MIVLRTKLLIPSFAANRQPRPRLVAAVREQLRGGAALVVAPAGYGKTVLLAELVEGAAEPTVWLQLDETDNDPAALVAALTAGAQRAFPALGELDFAAGAEAGRGLLMLINALSDLGQDDWLLVLDDLHLVTNPDALKLIERLLDAAPPGMRLLMASRSLPSLPLARWRARGMLGIVAEDVLRFTAEDAGAWLRRELPGLADSAVVRLVDRTEGWAVGLQLASQLLRGEDDQAANALVARLQGDHPVVAGFLLEEVFARQPRAVQRFLLDTAVLPQFGAAACAALLADGPAADAPTPAATAAAKASLERLELGQAFMQRLDEGEGWYRYHQLFREFLLSLAERRDPQRLMRLHRRAAEAAEAAADLGGAVAHYLACHDAGAAADLLERHGPRHLLAGRGEGLHRWLAQLEPEVAARPALRALQGRVLQQRGRLVQAVAAFHEARRLASLAADHDVACAAVTQMAAIGRSQGDYLRAQSWAEEATALAEHAAVRAETRAEAWMERAKTEGHLSGMAGGRRLAERSLAELEASAGPGDDHDPTAAAHLHAALGCSLGQICWWQGDVDAAVRHLQRALDRLGDVDTPQAADVRLVLATPTLYRFDHATAMAHAERALVTYQRFEQHERMPAAYAVLGNALTRAGDLDRAEACLRQAMASAAEIGGASHDHVMAAGYLAQLLELQGRTAEAIQVAEEALWAHEGAPTVYEVYVCRSVLADTYLSAGRLDDAERIYRHLVELGEERQYRIPLALAYFGLAYLHLARADRAEGVALAERSLELLSPTHAWRLYADQGERARVVGAALQEAHPGDPFLARVQAGLAQPPVARVRAVGGSPGVGVSVVALGELRVSVDGEALEPGAWVSAKAHDLLAFMITMRSERIGVEQALHALWPDEPERAKTAFHTALYRLRGALRRGSGEDAKYVLTEGRKYRLDVARVAVDVDRFDALVLQARQAEAPLALDLLSAAVGMVGGEYLAGLDYPWLAGERRRLTEAHIEALARLGELQLRLARPADAALSARRQAALDPYSERACVLEMRALAALGDMAAAERRYREFCEQLRAELGLEPAAGTALALGELRVGAIGRGA